MRLLRSLALCALTVAFVAAKPPQPSAFDKYAALQGSSPTIELDAKAYDELTTPPRDYSVAILLTAIDPRYMCKLCQDFQEEWEIIGRSWQKGGESRVLFGTIDFDKEKSIFQRLQLQTAPVLFFFPPTVGPGAKADAQPLRFDFNAAASAEEIHNWIIRHLPPGHAAPPLKRPFNYTRLVVTTTVAIGIFTLGTVAWPWLVPVIQNRKIWAGVSLVLILLFTSGHMYNHIRKVPYVAGDGRGGIQYFAGGFSNQFGMETQIVAAMYALLSFCAIALAINVPRIRDPKSQQLAVIIWSSVLFTMYSFLLSVFRVKNAGYPFWLPPF